ncbi:MAG: hypothetical protein LBQ50_13320, partial [Planctomycetaceae bacterium]|nr:hypothetical protein [Planctomycetaceae bacterium]
MIHFVVLILFLCTGTVFGFTESDVRFLRGLADRNLFESVEIFCNSEFQNPNVLAIQKTLLATELVRSRTQQMLLAEPVRRPELRKRLSELETQLLETPLLASPAEWNDPELWLARNSLRFQFAVAEYSLGDWQRLESEIVPASAKDEAAQFARTTLLHSLERFQHCTEQLEQLRQKTGLNTDPLFKRRFLVQLHSIRYQSGLAQMSFALTFPSGDDRIFSLNRAVVLLTELASLPVDDPVIFRSRIELATAHRLLGQLEKGKEWLTRLQNAELTPELRFQAEAELIRYYDAAGNIKEAVRKIEENHHDSSIYPDYELAKLEILLALSRQFKEKTEQQTEINRTILEQIRRIDLQFGAYWGRRARMFLGASHLTETSHIDTPLLKMLAEDQFQSGRYTEAVRFFEMASRQAEIAGDQDGMFGNAVSAIAVLSEVLNRLETPSLAQPEMAISQTEIALCRRQIIGGLRDLSMRYPQYPNAAELHLKAIDLSAQAVLKKEMPLDNYLVLLREHAEEWSDSVKIPPLLLRAAVLLESQGQSAEVLL